MLYIMYVLCTFGVGAGWKICNGERGFEKGTKMYISTLLNPYYCSTNMNESYSYQTNKIMLLQWEQVDRNKMHSCVFVYRHYYVYSNTYTKWLKQETHLFWYFLYPKHVLYQLLCLLWWDIDIVNDQDVDSN